MNARLDTALAHWDYVAPLLTPPGNDADYQSLVEALDAILDAGGADEAHPLAALAALVGDLVSDYETRRYPMPDAMSAVEALAFLIEQHGLRQSDLPEVGNQAKVSEILSGKRKINLRQAKSLAKRFGVAIDVFVCDSEDPRLFSARARESRRIGRRKKPAPRVTGTSRSSRS